MGCWFFFFFSSRRRHTRSLCDWSSDVCSAVMLERYAKITLEKPSSQYMGPYAGPEGVSMNKSVKIAASSFVDLQEILAKFNATLVSLSPDAELDQLGKKAGHAA